MTNEITIIHNPRCSKSRQTLELLEEKGIKPTIRLYLENPLTKEELLDIVKKLNISPIDLVRKNEEIFNQIIHNGEHFNNDSAIDLMVQNPKLIQRPIVINNNRAKIGRPPESVLEIL